MNKTELAWHNKTRELDDFASPWSSGKDFRAYAYPTARTFAAALAGFKGKRKGVTFHMLNTGEAGAHDCVTCGGKLNAPAVEFTRAMGNNTRVESPAGEKVDQHSTWRYVPGKGIAGGQHYICSWSMLLGQISAIRVAA